MRRASRALVLIALALGACGHGPAPAGSGAGPDEPSPPAAAAAAPTPAPPPTPTPAPAAMNLQPDAQAALRIDGGAGDVVTFAGGADAPAAPSRCDKNALLCDGFEAGALDASKWSVLRRYATVEVDTTRAARGKASLHVKLDNAAGTTDNHGWLVTKRTFPVAGNHLFVRAFVFIDPAATPDRHFDVIKVQDTQHPLAYTINLEKDLYTKGTPDLFRYLWSHGAPEPAEIKVKQAAPLGRWTCWQWEIRGASNELAFSLDGQPVPGLTIDAAKGWTAPGTARFQFGDSSYHTDANHPQGFQLWLDEIVISTEEIGCAS